MDARALQLLERKVCVITGAASGIGEAAARAFVGQGARVILADVQHEKGAGLQQELGSEAAEFVRCDVSQEEDVARAVHAAVKRFGRLDVMVNNAGVVGAMGPISEMRGDDFRRTLDVNLAGPFYGIKHAARAMRSQVVHGGSIVNISSIAGIQHNLSPAGYTCSKAALNALTRLAACELAPHGIRVNAIAPGLTATCMVGLAGLGNADAPTEEVEQYTAAASPLKGHNITAADIARAMLYLASDRAQAINGHTMVIDLGVTAGVTGRPPPMSTCPPVFLAERGPTEESRERGSFEGLGGGLVDALKQPGGG